MRRDRFLGRVAQATLRARLPAAEPPRSEPPAPVAVDLVARFRARAQSVNAVVHGPMSRHGVPRAVSGIAAGHGARSFIAWDELPVAGITSALAASGLDRVDHETPQGERLEHNLGYSSVEVGVTGSSGALAESGSVILVHGPGRPRMASLIPDVHIALVEVTQIHRTLEEWAAQYPTSPEETANLVLVTGPSRTGDIEQELNLGVHGPRHVHVVLIR